MSRNPAICPAHRRVGVVVERREKRATSCMRNSLKSCAFLAHPIASKIEISGRRIT